MSGEIFVLTSEICFRDPNDLSSAVKPLNHSLVMSVARSGVIIFCAFSASPSKKPLSIFVNSGMVSGIAMSFFGARVHWQGVDFRVAADGTLIEEQDLRGS